MTVRRVGIEEELLLVDATSGIPHPVAQEVLDRCCRGVGSPTATVKHEFFLSQVEINSRPHRDLRPDGQSESRHSAIGHHEHFREHHERRQ